MDILRKVSGNISNQCSLRLGANSHGIGVELIARIRHYEQPFALFQSVNAIDRCRRHPTDTVKEEFVAIATLVGNRTRKDFDGIRLPNTFGDTKDRNWIG